MSRRKDNNSLKSLCEQMNMNYNTFLKFRKAHPEYINMSNLELIQFWQSTHTKRISNEHLIKLAKQHGIKESAICQYKRSHKGLTDEIKKQLNVEIDKKNIKLSDNIKTSGSFEVEVKLHKGISTKLTVKVETI